MAFEVIPVIDLMGGRAVRAVAGNRAGYRPLATPLCPDGEPLSAARGFLGVHDFRRLYLADLDAIAGGARQDAVLGRVRAAFPRLELWVDAGFASAQDAADWLRLGLGRPVFGSESLADAQPPASPGAILSLDFRGDRFLGPPALLDDPALWPADVIVMGLHDVGTGRGPDTARLQRILQAAGARRVYAAGGVRGRADLEALARLGVSGALVASALHDGAIASSDLGI
jgi:phosphoribosylformimino-5-aminoimidazole carboxamide ribotide isomerase